MTAYFLRNVDPKVWAKVKERASQDGYSLRDLIEALLRAYGDGEVHVSIQTSVRVGEHP